MISGIILAAGASTRFGSQKLLAPVDGKPIVYHATRHALAASLDELVVVVSPDSEMVQGAVLDLPVRLARGGPEEMSTSLRAGVAAVAGDPRVEAVVVLLGDQPAIAPAVIDALIAEFRRSGKPVVVPLYQGERGHPALFAASIFPELLAVRGDRGARDVIATDPSRVATVRFDFAVPRDVDTPADLHALRDGRNAPLPDATG
ncbi:MAG: nucleotidyltransferase family protein [Gemmatimonadota bacterium]|nr:nucleotidyltransferase family protein [Gemmatimonadota bacterium]